MGWRRRAAFCVADAPPPLLQPLPIKADPAPPASYVRSGGRGRGRGRGRAAGPAAVPAPAPAPREPRAAAAPAARAAPPSSSSSSSSDSDVAVVKPELAAAAAPPAGHVPPDDLGPRAAAAAVPPSPFIDLAALGAGAGDGLTLLHVPARLPAASPRGGLAAAADLAPGVVGRVLLLASGAVKVVLGGVEYDAEPGLPVDALTAGLLIPPAPTGAGAPPSPPAPRSAACLGTVRGRVTLVPSVAGLLAAGGPGARARRRAPGCKLPADLDAEWEAAAVAADAMDVDHWSPGGAAGLRAAGSE